MGTIKVLIADDHPIFREGLAMTISKDPELELLGETGTADELLDLIGRKRPDIVVSDISMPGKTGLELTEELKNKYPDIKIIILTMYNDENYFNKAMDSGALGYILKDSISSELTNAIKEVSKGNFFISPAISGFLLKKSRKPEELTELDKLTPSEKQILKLISQNKTSREIADELFISTRTVQNHRNNICLKLNLSGHNKLLLYAIENKSSLK